MGVSDNFYNDHFSPLSSINANHEHHPKHTVKLCHTTMHMYMTFSLKLYPQRRFCMLIPLQSRQGNHEGARCWLLVWVSLQTSALHQLDPGGEWRHLLQCSIEYIPVPSSFRSSLLTTAKRPFQSVTLVLESNKIKDQVHL